VWKGGQEFGCGGGGLASRIVGFSRGIGADHRPMSGFGYNAAADSADRPRAPAPTTGENVLRVQQPGEERGVQGRWAAGSFGGSGTAQHRRVEWVGPGVAVMPVRDGDGVGLASQRHMMQELSRGGSPTHQMRSGHRDVDGDHGDTGGRRASWMSAGARRGTSTIRSTAVVADGICYRRLCGSEKS
jgi:hypothetical protein